MKCPKRFNIVQKNINIYVYDGENKNVGHNHVFIENQEFGECYEHKCVAWDNKKKICKEMKKS